jgi:hypothetical protein
MLITKPNGFVAEIHDRMPVLLAEKDFEPWLSGEAGIELLKPAPDDLLQRGPCGTSTQGRAELRTVPDFIGKGARGYVPTVPIMTVATRGLATP